MTNLTLIVPVVFVAGLLASCGDTDCSTVKPYGQITAFTTSCNDCHSSTLSGADRQSAPADFNFDSYDGAIHETGESAEEVAEGKMPPPDGNPISDEERADLLTWLRCGTPE